MNDFIERNVAAHQSATGTITVTDYTLLAGKTITVDATVLTEGVDFNAVTSNNTTATNIATAATGVALVAASASGAVVTVKADAPGTGGNSIALATNAVTGLTLSGATLSGGVAESYTEIFDYTDVECENVEIALEVVSKTGTLSLVVTPQVSFDNGGTWFDSTAFTTATAATKQILEVTATGSCMRFKKAIGGSANTVDFNIFALAK